MCASDNLTWSSREKWLNSQIIRNTSQETQHTCSSSSLSQFSKSPPPVALTSASSSHVTRRSIDSCSCVKPCVAEVILQVRAMWRKWVKKDSGKFTPQKCTIRTAREQSKGYHLKIWRGKYSIYSGLQALKTCNIRNYRSRFVLSSSSSDSKDWLTSFLRGVMWVAPEWILSLSESAMALIDVSQSRWSSTSCCICWNW